MTPVPARPQGIALLERAVLALCIEGAGPQAAALDRAERVLAEIGTHREVTVSATGGVLLVRPSAARARLPAPKELRRLGQVAQSAVALALQLRPWVGIACLRRGEPLQPASGQARRAIELAKRVFSEPRVVLYEDLLALEGIDADPARLARLAAILDPVTEANQLRAPVLLRSLEAFFDQDLSATAAAKRLGIHRHTIDHQLTEIERILGRSVRRGHDRYLVETAVRARRLMARPT